MASLSHEDMKVLRQRLNLDARTKPGMLAAAAALPNDSSLDPSIVLKELPYIGRYIARYYLSL